jgi:hypothetical protein
MAQVCFKSKSTHDLVRIQRFTSRVLMFSAFSGIRDVEAILKSLDNSDIHGASGTSKTTELFPRAYHSGFRLENEAPALMAAIAAVAPQDRAGAFEFPADETFLAIRSFIAENACHDGPHMRIPDDAWDQAVKFAKLREAMLRMTSQELDWQRRSEGG